MKPGLRDRAVRPLVAALLLVVGPALRADDRFTLSGDLRLRHTVLANVGLRDVDPNADRTFQRYRLRLRADAVVAGGVRATARLLWEGRHYAKPDGAAWPVAGFESWYGGALLFDLLALELKRPGGLPFDARVGRQEIVLGDGWLVQDGTPIDGSRTGYFDAARITFGAASAGRTVDLVWLDQSADTGRFPRPLLGGTEDQLEQGELAGIAPVATALIGQVQSRRALYVAMLLHDIAKGRGGDHSELGAAIAQELGPRLGLSAEETESVSWLVLHHLVLSQTAFRRDIDDPKTILDLAELVQSPERLRLLMALTVADMRAVSSKVWNNWKATLLREIYWRVAEVLAGGAHVPPGDTRGAPATAGAAPPPHPAGWKEADRDAFLALGYPAYWLGFDPDTHLRHARLIRDAEAAGQALSIKTVVLAERGVTEVTVYTADHPGLFSRIAGALAVAGASIVDARIHTMTNGMALDTFWIQDAAGGAFDAPHRIARMSVLIEQALSGRLRIAEEIRKARPPFPRTRAIHVPPRVVIDNHASATHTVVEVNGRDRPGLLHDVTAAMSEQGIQIASAHITTYGVRAVDVFYVKDVFGLKIENERKLSALKEALLAALEVQGGTSSGTQPEAA